MPARHLLLLSDLSRRDLCLQNLTFTICHPEFAILRSDLPDEIGVADAQRSCPPASSPGRAHCIVRSAFPEIQSIYRPYQVLLLKDAQKLAGNFAGSTLQNGRASQSRAHIPLEEKTREPRTISAAEHSVPAALQAPAAEAQEVWRTSRHPPERSASIRLSGS